jgi:hypothetical protein
MSNTLSVEEGNKLIAEFMGISVFERYGDVRTYPSGSTVSKRVQYHKSWDWLMPIVEKIEKEHQAEFIIASQVEEKDGEVTWYQDAAINLWTDEGQRYFETSSSSKIQSVWDIIIQFIQWHNQNKK